LSRVLQDGEFRGTASRSSFTGARYGHAIYTQIEVAGYARRRVAAPMPVLRTSNQSRRGTHLGPDRAGMSGVAVSGSERPGRRQKKSDTRRSAAGTRW